MSKDYFIQDVIKCLDVLGHEAVSRDSPVTQSQWMKHAKHNPS